MGFGHLVVVSLGNVTKLARASVGSSDWGRVIIGPQWGPLGKAHLGAWACGRSARGAVLVLIYHCPAPRDEASASSLTITVVLS